MLDDRLLVLERLDFGCDVLGQCVQRAELRLGILAERADLREGLELALQVGDDLGRLRGVGARLERGLTACLGVLRQGRDPGPKLVEVVLQRAMLVEQRMELFPETRQPFLELHEGGAFLLQSFEACDGALRR